MLQHANAQAVATHRIVRSPTLTFYEESHPYGTTIYRAVDAGTAASAKRYRYTGKERDEETGLYFHGARYYACWLGRWTASDPIGISGGLNLYEYAASSPTVLSDPTGHSPQMQTTSGTEVSPDADNPNAGLAGSFTYGEPRAPKTGAQRAEPGASASSAAPGPTVGPRTPPAASTTGATPREGSEPVVKLGTLSTDTPKTRREMLSLGLDAFLTPPDSVVPLGRRRAEELVRIVEEAGVPIGDFDETLPAGDYPILFGANTAKREQEKIRQHPANVRERQLATVLDMSQWNPLLGPLASIGVAGYDHLRRPRSGTGLAVAITIGAAALPFGIGKIGNFSGIVGYIASKNLPLPQVAAGALRLTLSHLDQRGRGPSNLKTVCSSS